MKKATGCRQQATASKREIESARTAHGVIVVGGGAAGLATAIFAARANPRLNISVLDGAKKLGAKILVSGGGRCNVTNVAVRAEDFSGGSRNVVRRILRAFTESQAVEFFQEIGVALHEEEYGKLFPDSNSAQTVLDALLGEADRLSVSIRTECRVVAVERFDSGYRVGVQQGGQVQRKNADRVVLATGGRSLPRTGSDGGGYELARSLGHSIVEPTPGLVPLVLDGDFHVPLSGVSQAVELIVRVAGEKAVACRGSMLWTHFGVSGPAVLDASRHWHRARVEGRAVTLAVNFLPHDTFDSAERMLLATAKQQPRTHLRNALAALWPERFVDAVLAALAIAPATPMSSVSREVRRRLAHALIDWPLPVRDSRGYNYAEVTAGGVPLSEVDPSTLESRKSPGLFLVGEILDVDGRIGGFNFQWAWSTGKVAGEALAKQSAAVDR